ncbi:something about silencing protein 10 [Choloepus didactylus]|uniref:something about silencing protein 10 n=1 Tax=Choloepus didactylus TaxID=27675 RepID=UPI00189FD4C7|nr:something about silencing protein 10 [Choloepus didactylus]
MVGRSRRRGAAKWAAVRAKAGRAPADENEDDLELPPSPGDSSYYQDQVDDFHEARSRATLAKGWSEVESGDEENGDEEEEVLGLDIADEDEEDEEDDEDGASAGDEGSDGDDDGGGSSVQSETEASVDPSLSWGQRKKLYYDTDYGSKSRGRRSQQEVEEEEREEEEEAQLIQQRLAQALQEDDFGVSWVEAFAKPAPRVDEAETRVVKDLAKVSVKEKLKMLRKESPELLELIDDLKVRLTEVKDELEPLLQLAEQGIIPPGKGSQYLRTKYNLYLNYCSNITFYLILKARRVPAHGHPVIERLVTYRNLINKLSIVDQKLSSEIRYLLTLKDGAGKKELNPKPKSTKAKPKSALQTSAVSAVTELSDDSDFDEATALEYYKEVEDRQKLKRKKEESTEEQAREDQNAKRAITYQIAKNKGLTPRRKKIDRNPRVKHREKFRRAKIRRRGQVREVRREEQRYSGELSGIRAGIKKSIKLK